MLPPAKGRGSKKDALKGEGQPPSICLPWEIQSQPESSWYSQAGRELLPSNSSSSGSRDGGKPGLCPSSTLLPAV